MGEKSFLYVTSRVDQRLKEQVKDLLPGRIKRMRDRNPDKVCPVCKGPKAIKSHICKVCFDKRGSARRGSREQFHLGKGKTPGPTDATGPRHVTSWRGGPRLKPQPQPGLAMMKKMPDGTWEIDR